MSGSLIIFSQTFDEGTTYGLQIFNGQLRALAVFGEQKANWLIFLDSNLNPTDKTLNKIELLALA